MMIFDMPGSLPNTIFWVCLPLHPQTLTAHRDIKCQKWVKSAALTKKWNICDSGTESRRTGCDSDLIPAHRWPHPPSHPSETRSWRLLGRDASSLKPVQLLLIVCDMELHLVGFDFHVCIRRFLIITQSTLILKFFLKSDLTLSCDKFSNC